MTVNERICNTDVLHEPGLSGDPSAPAQTGSLLTDSHHV